MIYLDYNATTPIDAIVKAAMLMYLDDHYGNPSSQHALGQAAKDIIDKGRYMCAAAIGAEPDEIIFTSGGTESSNLAIKGGVLPGFRREQAHVVISSLEHPATVEPARFLERMGLTLTVVPCDASGVIDPDEFRKSLRPETRLASIMHANNEIGTVQPIRRIADICRERGVLFHVDAAQSLGKIPVNVNELGADLLSIAGHKVYAPKGVGALYVRRGVTIEPVMHGAAHERGLRAGTENTPYIVALATAMRIVPDYLASEGPANLATLRNQLEGRLLAGIGEELTINGAGAARLPNTLSVNFPGVVGGELLAHCPELCASTGAACHSGETKMSATLAAIGLRPQTAAGAVRLSLGRKTTENEIERAAEMLTAAWKRLRR